jgi:putative ABC transport system permease protein
MDRLLQDLRFALRQTLKQPAFAAVVVVTLGLAVGVNSLIFSFVNFFVLRPLPFGDVSRTVMLFATHAERADDRMAITYADFADWRRDNRSFESMGAYRSVTHALTGVGDPERLHGSLATASLFSIWQLEPVHGRVLQPDDDRPGAPRVALLSHGFWSRRFGADPGVVGRTVVLDGEPAVVVGVLTPRIEVGTLSEIDVWTSLDRVAAPLDREERKLRVTARLRPDADVTGAGAELQALAAVQAREHPATNAGWGVTVMPIRRAITGANSWTVLALLAVAVALVLAVACANVANLILARASARQRETAVRTALGATRSRLVRQFLTEGTVLSVLGGVLGLALAALGLDLIRSVTFEQFFQLVTIDRRVLAFSAAISLLTPIVFGLVPALQATRSDVVSGLKDSGGGAVGVSRGRGRNLLVVGQLAIALSLLLVAGLAVRMAVYIQRLDLGFDIRNLVTVRAELPAARYPSDDQVRALVARFQEQLAAVPGVTAVAVTTVQPLLSTVPTEALAIEGAEPPSREALPWTARAVVGAGYFETLGIPIVKGRSVAASDAPGAEPVVVVNQAFVRRYLAQGEPLGRRVRLGAAEAPWRTVVGVSRDAVNTDPGEPLIPQAYVPFAQQPARGFTFLVRTADAAPVVAAARRAMTALDPQQPLYDVRTMERALFEALASNRVITGLFGALAVVALGLATVGLYGLVSYTVSLRTREIGVRVALGAGRRDILGLVLSQGLRLAVAGLTLGLFVGIALARVMASALVGVSATDPLTFTLVPVLLAVIAIVATAIPARRAAGSDPAVILRAE